MKESSFHDWLRSTLPPAAGVPVGVGDDAALLEAGGQIVAATDLLIEGIHYDAASTSPEQIGAKAVNRNLSDIAAMGLEACWLLVGAALPSGTTKPFIEKLVRGMLAAAEPFGAVLVGGDTARTTGPLVLDVTVIGTVGELTPILRSGAAPGESLMVTGALGGSILGKHMLFTPCVREGLFLNRHYQPTAMIDISDGLDRDLFRLLDASGGLGVKLDGEAVPVSAAAHELAATTGKEPLEHALTDGEDFELLFTLPPGRARDLLADGRRFFPVAEIGSVTPPGERVLLSGGGMSELKGAGFDHEL